MEEKELTVRTEKVLIDLKTVQDFLFTSDTKLNDRQKSMFMQLAIRNQLDPFKREIYAIPFGSNFNIVTGYQVYIQRAESTGLLDGWDCNPLTNDKGELVGATITIYRKDFKYPFKWEVALAEFHKEQSNWKTMPEFMIKKVCIGQGFRLAFPNELGGMPYLAEELEGLQPASGTIKPPQSKTEVKPDPQTPPADTTTIITGIEKVTMKTGEKGGKTWTKYTVHAGDEYNTFSKTFAEEAKKASEAGLQVALEFKTSTYGNDIVSLKIQEPAAEPSVAIQPREVGEEG